MTRYFAVVCHVMLAVVALDREETSRNQRLDQFVLAGVAGVRERRHASSVADDADDLCRRSATPSEVGGLPLGEVPVEGFLHRTNVARGNQRPRDDGASDGLPGVRPTCFGHQPVDVNGHAEFGESLAHLPSPSQSVGLAVGEERLETRVSAVDEIPEHVHVCFVGTPPDLDLPAIDFTPASHARRATSAHADTVS